MVLYEALQAGKPKRTNEINEFTKQLRFALFGVGLDCLLAIWDNDPDHTIWYGNFEFILKPKTLDSATKPMVIH